MRLRTKYEINKEEELECDDKIIIIPTATLIKQDLYSCIKRPSHCKQYTISSLFFFLRSAFLLAFPFA